VGQQRRGHAPQETAPPSQQRPLALDEDFALGNDAARAALAHGGGDPEDDDARSAARASLVHARLALQIHPLGPVDLARFTGILQASDLPADRKRALLERLTSGEERAAAVSAVAGADATARASWSDAIGAALARLDDGELPDPALAAVCLALSRIALDEGDEEALLADQVAEEQA
jgi:hypothetical protein